MLMKKGGGAEVSGERMILLFVFRKQNLKMWITYFEGVDNVRRAAFSHFFTHFQSRNVERPSMEALQFPSLSYREGASLVKLFSVEEVKAAVWDCDNYKCLCPDGITFSFIKDSGRFCGMM